MATLTDSLNYRIDRPACTIKPISPAAVARAPEGAALIVNMKARHGRAWFEKAQVCLLECGVRLAAAQALDKPEELHAAVHAAMQRGTRRVIIGGGDGTFRSVAKLLAHTDVTLGVLPFGTVNDLARNLGIKPDVETACRVIADGVTARIDIGQANDDVFLLTASLGFSALSQLTMNCNLKRRFGPFAYIMASLLTLRRLRGLQLTARANGRTENYQVLQAGVIKGHEWLGGRCQVPGLSLDTGYLAFYALPPQRRIEFLKVIWALMQGRFYHTPGLRSFAANEVVLTTRVPSPLVLDGDLCGYTPVRLRVLPEALRVFVPSGFPDMCGAG